MITSFSGPYRFLSNFWIVNLRIGDMHFISAEHAYQAAKSLDPQDWMNISTIETPGGAKRAGRLLKIRPDWDDWYDWEDYHDPLPINWDYGCSYEEYYVGSHYSLTRENMAIEVEYILNLYTTHQISHDEAKKRIVDLL